MMSLGNELWGSKEKLSQILSDYKAVDRRHLYTQGSNNFQHTPVILPEEDFLWEYDSAKTDCFVVLMA